MREIKFKGLYETTKGERLWAIYGIGSKPQLIGAYWVIEDLQYTGLRDSLGNEEYFGDIIEEDGYGRRTIEDGDSAVLFVGVENKNDIKYFWQLQPHNRIGNIYENPELLDNQPLKE